MKTVITCCDGEEIPITITVGQFHNGTPAVFANSDEGPYGRISVNIDYPFKPDEIAVKTYNENAHWVPQLLELMPTVFQDTNIRVPAGFAELQIWKFTPAKEKSCDTKKS
jgi:hypothetical protein